MNLVKIKKLQNHTLYVNQDTLEFVLKKTYTLDTLTLLTSLKHMKNTISIPQIYSLEQVDNQLIAYEQYIGGETVGKYISQGSFITRKQFVKYCNQLIDTLKCLHEINIIHKDIKPDNLIIDQDTIYLIDFDISRVYNANKSKDTRLLGTEGYASPEQYGFGQTTPKSDIYSLGKTLEDLLEITIIEPVHFEFYKSLIEQMIAYDPDNRCSLNNAQLELLDYEKQFDTQNEMKNTYADEINDKNTHPYYPWQVWIYTSHGIVFDIAATLFLGMFCFSFITDTVVKETPYVVFICIVSQLLSTIFFNRYLLAVSFPKFRKVKENSNTIMNVFRWFMIGILDTIVFIIAFQMCYDIITATLNFITQL